MLRIFFFLLIFINSYSEIGSSLKIPNKNVIDFTFQSNINKQQETLKDMILIEIAKENFLTRRNNNIFTCQNDKFGNEYCPSNLTKAISEWQYINKEEKINYLDTQIALQAYGKYAYGCSNGLTFYPNAPDGYKCNNSRVYGGYILTRDEWRDINESSFITDIAKMNYDSEYGNSCPVGYQAITYSPTYNGTACAKKVKIRVTSYCPTGTVLENEQCKQTLMQCPQNSIETTGSEISKGPCKKENFKCNNSFDSEIYSDGRSVAKVGQVVDYASKVSNGINTTEPTLVCEFMRNGQFAQGYTSLCDDAPSIKFNDENLYNECKNKGFKGVINTSIPNNQIALLYCNRGPIDRFFAKKTCPNGYTLENNRCVEDRIKIIYIFDELTLYGNDCNGDPYCEYQDKFPKFISSEDGKEYLGGICPKEYEVESKIQISGYQKMINSDYGNISRGGHYYDEIGQRYKLTCVSNNVIQKSCPTGYIETTGEEKSKGECKKVQNYTYYDYTCDGDFTPIDAGGNIQKVDTNNQEINDLTSNINSSNPPKNNCKKIVSKGKPVFVDNEWKCSPFNCNSDKKCGYGTCDSPAIASKDKYQDIAYNPLKYITNNKCNSPICDYVLNKDISYCETKQCPKGDNIIQKDGKCYKLECPAGTFISGNKCIKSNF